MPVRILPKKFAEKSQPMTDDQKRINEIETRADAATEGPWIRRENLVDGYEGFVAEIFQPERDADFIAHSREDIPWLIKLARGGLKMRADN